MSRFLKPILLSESFQRTV